MGIGGKFGALGQWWVTGERSGFSFRQAFAATVAGAAGGAAGYMASRALFKACFAADMPMRTKFGSVRADEVCVGMKLLSRDEYDADGVVEEREVEEVFVRQALIWNLRVLGQLIRSTAEHPFYVRDKGWVPLHSIVAGDYVGTEASGWLCVEAVEDTGAWEKVYNFRIAERHTYFVGEISWGWALWAHNTSYKHEPREQNSPEDPVPALPPFVHKQQEFDGNGRTTGILVWEGPLNEATGMPTVLWTEIMSGNATSRNNVPNHRVPTAGEFPGIPTDSNARTHVEVKAVTFMRDNEISSAILKINNPDGPCGSCHPAVPEMLPPGWSLVVEYPGTAHTAIAYRGQ